MISDCGFRISECIDYQRILKSKTAIYLLKFRIPNSTFRNRKYVCFLPSSVFKYEFFKNDTNMIYVFIIFKQLTLNCLNINFRLTSYFCFPKINGTLPKHRTKGWIANPLARNKFPDYHALSLHKCH